MIKILSTNRPLNPQTLAKAVEGVSKTMARNDLGFLRLPLEDRHWESAANRAQQIQSPVVVCAGIGGSSLGPKVFQEISDSNRVQFLDNTDPVSMARLWGRLPSLDRVHWIWTSKSGTTLETLAQLEHSLQWAGAQSGVIVKNSTVVSDPGANSLTNWARSHGVPTLEIPADVGGRYSVLTPVGLLPAALMGVRLSEVREGAQWALKQTDLVANLVALTLESWAREEWVTMFWSYCDQLKTFGAWVQQLWAESLAKKVTRAGGPAPRVSFPVAAVGAVDQHSILQQIVEGARDKWVWMTRVAENENEGRPLVKAVISENAHLQSRTMGQIFATEAEATALGLDQVGVSQVVVRWDNASAKSIGAGFVLFELIVGSLGEAIGINAYDQPGVQVGKLIADRILRK